MKTGQRAVNVGAAVVKTIDGEDVSFSGNETIMTSIVNRREGICEVRGKGQFKCKKIKGISSVK